MAFLTLFRIATGNLDYLIKDTPSNGRLSEDYLSWASHTFLRLLYDLFTYWDHLGDNWNGIMKDTLREECDSSEECLRSE